MVSIMFSPTDSTFLNSSFRFVLRCSLLVFFVPTVQFMIEWENVFNRIRILEFKRFHVSYCFGKSRYRKRFYPTKYKSSFFAIQLRPTSINRPGRFCTRFLYAIISREKVISFIFPDELKTPSCLLDRLFAKNFSYSCLYNDKRMIKISTNLRQVFRIVEDFLPRRGVLVWLVK